MDAAALRATGPGHQPVDPLDALASLLRAAGGGRALPHAPLSGREDLSPAGPAPRGRRRRARRRLVVRVRLPAILASVAGGARARCSPGLKGSSDGPLAYRGIIRELPTVVGVSEIMLEGGISTIKFSRAVVSFLVQVILIPCSRARTSPRTWH